MRHARFTLILVLVFGGPAACATGGESGLFPFCSDAAPLFGEPEPLAPGYFVLDRCGVDAVSETERLAATYGFVPNSVYDQVAGFAADLTPFQLAEVRCESTVASVYYNGVFYLNGSGAP